MLNFKIVESQKLIFSKGPVVAADTTNLEAKFEVNDLFNGTLRAYWNVRGSAVDSFAVDLDASGTCTIPSEVLASISDPSMYGDIDHILQVSVVSIGDDDTIRITSTTCEIPVYKSSYTGNISQPSRPSGDGNVTNIITGAALNGKQLDFYNGNNVIFSAPLDRLDSFLLPLLGGTMTGDINMDGHAITGLPNAVNDTDALALAFAKTLFAPSGYGLGETNGRTCADANNATEIGFYSMSGSEALNVPSGYEYAQLTITRRNFDIYQILVQNGIILFRQSADGGENWEEWSFVNPPMILGVEYRTTERLNGKAVYAKYFNAGVLMNNTEYSLPSGATQLVRFGGHISNGIALPVGVYTKNDTALGYFAFISAGNGGKSVWAYTDTRSDGYGNGGHYLHLILHYTKD